MIPVHNDIEKNPIWEPFTSDQSSIKYVKDARKQKKRDKNQKYKMDAKFIALFFSPVRM